MESIEFMGMPKAGKSTQLELIETFLKHEKRVSVRTIYEGARVCPIDKKTRFQHNAWSFHNTTNRLMEAQLTDPDYLLIDRGVYDHIAFTQALYRSGQITTEQYEAQARYFREFGFLEDSVIALMINPDEAMKREMKYHQFCGRVMNDNFLALLYEAYKETTLTIPQSHIVIDSSKTVKENNKEIWVRRIIRWYKKG